MIIAGRPRRPFRCRIGFHWWSVLSCDPSAPGEQLWRRHCLLCGLVQHFNEVSGNDLKGERILQMAARRGLVST